jgi:hypothetical protein
MHLCANTLFQCILPVQESGRHLCSNALFQHILTVKEGRHRLCSNIFYLCRKADTYLFQRMLSEQEDSHQPYSSGLFQHVLPVQVGSLLQLCSNVFYYLYRNLDAILFQRFVPMYTTCIVLPVQEGRHHLCSSICYLHRKIDVVFFCCS